MPRERILKASTRIPLKLEEVFRFFSDAKNLETITPPWLHFKILSQSTPQIQEGTEFHYKLRIKGIPVFWRSKILDWKPPTSFVDIQLNGPYNKWHHTHTFREENGGTRMEDVVIYSLPFGALGDLLMGWYVKADVENIFKYREKIIQEKMGKV